MAIATHDTSAVQIASAARYATCSQATLGKAIGTIGDQVYDASNRCPAFVVDQHAWEHLPKRAKTFGGQWQIARGWHASLGRAYGQVVAEDGSVCTVVLS